MDTQNNQEEGWQTQGESLNTGSAAENTSGAEGEHHSHKKGGIHNNALYAAGMARSATAQVDPHSNSGLANTGTNISYEGATAPGAGGSVGTGYASGKEATGETISTDSDYAQAAVGKHSDKAEDNDNVTGDYVAGDYVADDYVTDENQIDKDDPSETGPAMGY